MSSKTNFLILGGLAMSTFALGITEFISVGILPLIATSFNVTVFTASLTVSIYALTVTIGTPIITSLFSHYSKKKVILGALLVLIVGNIISALAPTFLMLLLGRIICGLSHGIFMAIGSIIAAEILPEEKKATGIAIMFTGLTFSTILGVPFGTLIGTYLNWRMTFLFIIIIGLISLIYNIIFLPSNLSKTNKLYFRDLIRTLVHRRLILIFLMTALGYGATFAPFTYIFPILSNYGHYSSNVIIVILMLYGICVAIGNIVGGKLGNIVPAKLLFFIFIINLVILILYGIVISSGIANLILTFTLLMGLLAFMNVPPLQLYVIKQSHNNNSLIASAINISFFNLGITLGSYAGKITGSYINIPSTAITGAIILLFSSLIALYLWQTDN